MTALDVDPDIAIVGMAGRFPGARNLDEYWANLRAGVESISFFSTAELAESGVDTALLARPNYVRAAPVLDDPSLFDAAFFGYAPSEARLIDPQHRLFLECAWTAMEHAGYDPARHDCPVGVFGGAAINSYLLHSGLLLRMADDYLATLASSDKDFLATRVSYKLDLTGPSITVQTACSTSLVAVHLAGQSLLSGECDMALAGGVSVRVPHRVGYLCVPGGIVSPDGHCRPFDADAGGTVFGSGVGIVVLKRLADAVAGRDTIHAVIKGSAVNNDGSAKVSYSAPSVQRQAAAIVQALGDAAVDPATISYVEAHGTGTRVGDPVEIAALTRAFRTGTADRGFCTVGSVKSNIGHLDAAAGVAGLIKTVLALEHAEIPPTLHFREPNPEIGFGGTPFVVNDGLSAWSVGPAPRRAAVNALGVGGTNAHVILEQAPPQKPAEPTHPPQLLVLSAATSTALAAVTSAVADRLTGGRVDELADVAHTLWVGRRPLPHRRAVLCSGPEDAVSALRTLDPHRAWSAQHAAEAPDVVFMLPGQGAQRPGMGCELYRTEAPFRSAVDRCAELFGTHLPTDLRAVLFADGESARERLGRTMFTQPALFTISYALAQLWFSWGLRPAALIGHSIGELAAACLAGVFSLEDAVALVAVRGRLMEDLPPGAMLAVHLAEDQLMSYMDESLALAAVNGPAQCVAAGEVLAVKSLCRRLDERGIRSHRLRVSRAFHSAMMDPAVEPFLAQLRGIRLHAPSVPFISNVTGEWIRDDEATGPWYWASQLRRTVRLAAGFRTLAGLGDTVLLEVGPGRTMCGIARQQTGGVTVLPSLTDPGDGGTEPESVLSAAGRLWLAGAELDPAVCTGGGARRRVPLPTYPFDRRRFWVEPGGAAGGAAASTVAAGLPPAPVEPSPAARSAVRGAAADEPRTPVEAAVLGVWQSVLGAGRIGVRDNFYALGGHSMMLPDVVGRIGAMFQIDLPTLTLMEAPTVGELAERIEDIFRIRGETAYRSPG